MATASAFLTPEKQAHHRSQVTVSLAQTEHEINECLRLRYDVFAGEMRANLHTDTPGLDQDRFDPYCKHLMVRDTSTGEVIGTTRVLTSEGAEKVGYFYSETEFDLSKVLALSGRFMEIGRTCIHPDHRRGSALAMLWHGLARLTVLDNIDYMIGCASIPLSKGDRYVQSVLAQVRDTAYAPEELRVTPLIPLPQGDSVDLEKVNLPPLLKGYLRLGAMVCGEPYWDAAFNVADAFILLDTDNLAKRYARHFVSRA